MHGASLPSSSAASRPSSTPAARQPPRRGSGPLRGSGASGPTRRAIDTNDARRAYQLLQAREASRVRNRARHRNDPLPSSDGEEEEVDSPHPILDTHIDSIGTEGVQGMTNFTPTEIVRLYGFVSDYMTTKWNVGRGKRSKQTAVDVFFVTLSVLKNGCDWGILANSFGFKAPTFEEMIIRFLELLCPHLYYMYVDQAADTMKKVVASGHAFRHYPAARYAVDVTFQQSNVPSGTKADRDEYFSAKHKLHGYKTEISVIPTGLAINCSLHHRGSVPVGHHDFP